MTPWSCTITRAKFGPSKWGKVRRTITKSRNDLPELYNSISETSIVWGRMAAHYVFSGWGSDLIGAVLQMTCKSAVLHPWTYHSWQGAKAKCQPVNRDDIIVIQLQPNVNSHTQFLDVPLSTRAGSSILDALTLLFPSLSASFPCTLIDLTATCILPVNHVIWIPVRYNYLDRPGILHPATLPHVTIPSIRCRIRSFASDLSRQDTIVTEPC